VRERAQLVLAEREASERIAGGQMISETTIESGCSISDTVTKKFVSSVQRFGTPNYYDGENADEYCVSVVAYIAKEAR